MTKSPRTDTGQLRQQRMKAAKNKADHSPAFGPHPNVIAEIANAKRQKKQMHRQTNK
jgi:hypothetical protein